MNTFSNFRHLRFITHVILVISFTTVITKISSGQKNNLKATVLTDLKYSFEYERIFNSKVSFLLGYRINNTFYESSGSGFFLRSSKGENHGNRILISVRFNMLSVKKLRNILESIERKNNYDNNHSSVFYDRIYLAPIISYGNHEFEYSQGTFIKLPNCGMIPSKINANLKAVGLGLNIGYNRIYKHFNYDFGLNLTYNSVLNHSKGIQYSDGEFQEFPSDLRGFRPEFYFGIGYAF